MQEKVYSADELDIFVSDIVKSSATSFYWAMRLLPMQKRRAMYAIYAFCRQIDDIADDIPDINEKKQQLNQWEKTINSIYDGGLKTSYNPVALYLQESIKKYKLPKNEFIELIRGMEMDTHEAFEAPSLEKLQLYCRRVAGAVGLLSICVFGHTDEKSQQFAIALGEALQITNILRDTAEDFDLGRIYLPKELLEMAGIDENSSPKEILNHPNIGMVRAKLADMAELRYTEAKSLLTPEKQKDMLPAIIMMNIYYKIFEKMAKRGWEKTTPKVRLSKLYMLYIAFKTKWKKSL